MKPASPLQERGDAVAVAERDGDAQCGVTRSCRSVGIRTGAQDRDHGLGVSSPRRRHKRILPLELMRLAWKEREGERRQARHLTVFPSPSCVFGESRVRRTRRGATLSSTEATRGERRMANATGRGEKSEVF